MREIVWKAMEGTSGGPGCHRCGGLCLGCKLGRNDTKDLPRELNWNKLLPSTQPRGFRSIRGVIARPYLCCEGWNAAKAGATPTKTLVPINVYNFPLFKDVSIPALAVH